MGRPKRTDGKPPRTRRADRKLMPGKEVPGLAKLLSNPHGNGGNKVVLNKELLFEVAKTHASFDQLATIFGCSAMLLSDETKEWRPIIDQARAVAKHNLLSAQFSTAIQDRNPTMQIWLGKQYLDQHDTTKQEISGPDGKPVEASLTVKAVAYIPDNGRDTLPPISARARISHKAGEEIVS